METNKPYLKTNKQKPTQTKTKSVKDVFAMRKSEEKQRSGGLQEIMEL